MIFQLPSHAQILIYFVIILTIVFHINFSEKSASYGPTILTTTGIFATFLGIAIGLLDFDTSKIQDSVPSLINGLKTAFWASVIGVGGALTLKFRYFFMPNRSDVSGSGNDGEVTAKDIAKILQNIQVALIGRSEITLSSQIKMLRQENNSRLDELKITQQTALQKISEMGSKALVEALKDVIKDFNSKINDQFGENFKELNLAVVNLLKWQENYKTQINEITKAQSDTAKTMDAAAYNFQQLVYKSESFTKTANDLSNIIKHLDLQKNQLVSLLTSLDELLKSASGSLPEVENKIIELTNQITRAFSENQKNLNKALQENTAQTKNLLNNISQSLISSAENFNKTAAGLSSSLEKNQTDLHQALTASTKFISLSIENTEHDLSRINTEFNKQLKELAERTVRQVSILDAALSEELKKSLESLGRQLAALSEKFVHDYSPLTDKLREVVNISRKI